MPNPWSNIYVTLGSEKSRYYEGLFAKLELVRWFANAESHYFSSNTQNNIHYEFFIKQEQDKTIE